MKKTIGAATTLVCEDAYTSILFFRAKIEKSSKTTQQTLRQIVIFKEKKIQKNEEEGEEAKKPHTHNQTKSK